MKERRISVLNNEDQEYKDCIFGCNTCKICSDYLVQYYKNASLLTDWDKSIHIPHVMR